MEYVTVDLSASLFSTEGDETLLDVPSYSIPVPPSPLKIVYPTEPNIKVVYTQVLVKIKVAPGSRVLVDGTNLTDIVDSDGYAQKYVNLNEGKNEILVEVETYKHRKTEEIINVERPLLDVPIELTSPPSTHHEDEVWIYGLVEEGAEIYVDTSRIAAKVNPKELVPATPENGYSTDMREFEFKYALTDFGWNDIEIVATAADGRKSSLIHRVERIPDHRSYTRQAWPLLTNFDWLSTSTESAGRQDIRMQGRSHPPRGHRHFEDVSL